MNCSSLTFKIIIQQPQNCQVKGMTWQFLSGQIVKIVGKFYSFTPAAFNIFPNGQNPVKLLWNKLKPTKAGIQSQLT